ncbi:MAG: Ig-like domain-containing protein [Gemmatimonadaceae bacterium]|nr:Ig-like domain-containing protein [Gemmatimonadaceae bacterium]
MHPRASRSLCLATFVLLAACGGGVEATTPPVPVVASVTVTLASATIAIGQTTVATAAARDAQGASVTGRTAAWSSGTPSVASVDASGTVTGVAAGTSVITATIDGRTGQATVTVTPPPVATVTVALAAPMIAIGQTTQATAVLRDAAGAALTGRVVAWTSASPAVATVNGSTGLVTGISAGNAIIVATSEGRTGQATVTVREPVALGAVSLQRMDGQPIDPSNVAGRIKHSVDPVLPAGFRGVIEVKVRGRVMRTDSVFGAATSGRTLARTGDIDRELDTASPVTVLTARELTSTVLANGATDIETTLRGLPAGGPPVSTTVRTAITLRNDDAVRLFVQPARTTVINGTPVYSGSTNMYVQDLAYSGIAIDQVEVIAVGAQSTYGSQPIGGVINLITRTAGDVGKEFTVTVPGESPQNGMRFAIGLVSRGPLSYRIGDIPRTNGNAASIDGSLLATTLQESATITLPQGISYQYIPPQDLGIFPAGYTPVDASPRWSDNQAPVASPTAVAPLQRALVVGQRAWGSTGKLGLSGNYFGNEYSAATFVSPGGFTDNVAGVPSAPSYTWYASKARSTLFAPSSRVSDFGVIPQTFSREWYLGVSLSDRAGNAGFYPVKTNAANPYTTGNVMTPSAQLGQTDGLFGRITSADNVTNSGVLSGAVFSNPATLGNWKLSVSVTGLNYASNMMTGLVSRYGARADCLYGFSGCTVPEVLGSTANAQGTQLGFDLTMADLNNRWRANLGGTGEGVVEGAFVPYNAAGIEGMNAHSWQRPFISLFDFTSPTSQVAVTTTTPGNVNVKLTGADNLGLEGFEVGAYWNWPNPRSGQDLRIPFYVGSAGGNLAQGFDTNMQLDIAGAYPRIGSFFDPVSGAVTGPHFDIKGVYSRWRDWSHRWSSVSQVAWSNTEPIPPIASGLQIRHSTSTQTVCGGTVCQGNVPMTATFVLEAFTPVRVIPFPKGKVVLIGPGGDISFLDEDEDPDELQVTGGWRYTYTFGADGAQLRLPAGNYLAKYVMPDKDGKRVFFSGQFGGLNIVAPAQPNPWLTRPMRPLF